MKFIEIKNKFFENKINKKSLKEVDLYKQVQKWTYKELGDYLIFLEADKKFKGMNELDNAVTNRVINILFDLELNNKKSTYEKE